MKKYILLLLTTITFGQTYQNPTYGTVTTKTTPVSTTATEVQVIEASGVNAKMNPVNLPITTVPPLVKVIPTTPTLNGYLIGIDNAIANIVTTTAGLSQRIYWTADNTTVTAGTFFTSNANGKGTAVAGSPTALVLADNTKAYFNKDLISIAQPNNTIGYAGTYSGMLTVSANPTPNTTQQRFTVEIYRTNNGGTPIASGVSGAPIGDLGVTVVAILDSGIVNLVAGSISNVAVSGALAQQIIFLTGERLRYHVSAAKVGVGGGNVTFNSFYGTNYNAYYDVPVAITTDGTVNKSTVGGTTTTNALDNLNIIKANDSNTVHKTGAETISGVKNFTNYAISTIDMASGNPYYHRFQNEFGNDNITIGEIGVGNRAPAIKLIGRDINEEPEIFIGHNPTRNYGWITQSRFGNATYVLNRRNAGIDYSVYTIDNSTGNLSLGTVDDTHKLNVGGTTNIQGILSTDQNVVSSYYATSPENTGASNGAYRTQNNQGLVSRNTSNTVDIPLIKSDAANKVIVSDGGYNTLLKGNTTIDAGASFTIANLSGTGTRQVVADANGKLSANNVLITITTSTSITTATTDSNSVGQDGHHVIISNGVNAINLTCNGGVTTSYGKVGTGAITFVQGSGRTLVTLSGTAILNGIAGSTATIWSNGTTDYLSINNY